MTKALVTGCAGFIGSHLTESLLDDGHTVVGVDCFNDNYLRADKRANLERAREHDGFRLIEADLVDVPARALLDAEDVELRKVLGDLVFAVDDETMESEVLRLCEARGWSLGVAESLLDLVETGERADRNDRERDDSSDLADSDDQMPRTEVGRHPVGASAGALRRRGRAHAPRRASLAWWCSST